MVTITFEELLEEAIAKGYHITRLDRGPNHVGKSGLRGRHEIWLEGNYLSPYSPEHESDKPVPKPNFSSKIGIGSSLQEALEEAREKIAKRPSHVW